MREEGQGIKLGGLSRPREEGDYLNRIPRSGLRRESSAGRDLDQVGRTVGLN